MLIRELLPHLRGNLKLTFGYRTSNGRSKNNSICTCKASEWRDKVPVFILNARLDDISSSNIGTIRISLVDDSMSMTPICMRDVLHPLIK